MQHLTFQRSATWPTALCVLLTALSTAVPPAARAEQRQDLANAARQLQALERALTESAAASPIAPGARYHFDYPRLLADLGRVRAGIHHYLTPVRAQPRDAEALMGAYQVEGDLVAQPRPPAAQP
ncbi:integrative conjugative element protein, RAQPRD family [Delftia tsuruhatensis]|uniref:integrative conjugative element protein, RAQPRD family n=1 Tax=Delftia tsuruhatensis TaxID=180282 RepID=UPI001E6BB00C|nr:RAQPRD family integrative conjugative element protein [Delftia tsuruhatensis]CAB5670966.1 integrative conjugative element protein, RAQPRD family [Delftia tsuruhatensis]CAC9683117.1 integrative conjugative element protein, RAQPRD family [Delftia tsuruhatensis]